VLHVASYPRPGDRVEPGSQLLKGARGRLSGHGLAVTGRDEGRLGLPIPGARRP
jgi:hypothetical protein